MGRTPVRQALVVGLIGLGVVIAPARARADSCETYPGSQVYTDQNCDKPTARPEPRPAPAAKPPPADDLREKLRRSLGSAPSMTAGPSPQALAKAVGDARAEVQRALYAAARASTPAETAKARQAYSAAMTKLDRAYDAAATAASPEGASELRAMKGNDDARFADAADRSGLLQPPPAADAPPAKPAGPDNVGSNGGSVFVCDGPVASANVSCREVQPDGRSCVAVMASEGEVSWRDSTATPCSRGDIAQRDAFLANNPDARAEAKAAADQAFAMDPQETAAEIRRLTADGASAAACQTLIKDYIAAAEGHDGPASQRAHDGLKQAGGCGVLAQAEDQARRDAAPTAADPRFATRGDTPMLDQTAVPCDQQPEACAALVARLRAGTSPEATAALYANAIQVGLELGAMMSNAMLQQARSANMTTAGRSAGGGRTPIRHTYGQGSPTGGGGRPVNTGCVDCRTGTAQ